MPQTPETITALAEQTACYMKICDLIKALQRAIDSKAAVIDFQIVLENNQTIGARMAMTPKLSGTLFDVILGVQNQHLEECGIALTEAMKAAQ